MRPRGCVPPTSRCSIAPSATPREGVVPGRTHDLVAWVSEFTEWRADESAETWLRVLADPQTSGGLLLAVAPERADALAAALGTHGVLAARVGGIDEGRAGRIVVR